MKPARGYFVAATAGELSAFSYYGPRCDARFDLHVRGENLSRVELRPNARSVPLPRSELIALAVEWAAAEAKPQAPRQGFNLALDQAEEVSYLLCHLLAPDFALSARIIHHEAPEAFAAIVAWKNERRIKPLGIASGGHIGSGYRASRLGMWKRFVAAFDEVAGAE